MPFQKSTRPAPTTLEEWGSSTSKTSGGYKGGPRSKRKPADQRRQRAFVITGHCSQAINDAGIRSAMPPSSVIESLFTTHAEAVKAILAKS